MGSIPLDVAVFVLDDLAQIISLNNAAQRLLGITSSAPMIGRSWSAVAPPTEARAYDVEQLRRATVHLGAGREHPRWVSILASEGEPSRTLLWAASWLPAERTKGNGQLVLAGVEMGEAAAELARAARRGASAQLMQIAEGLQHKVGNLAAGVSGALDVFASRLPGDGKLQVVSKMIEDRLRAIRAAVEDLRRECTEIGS